MKMNQMQKKHGIELRPGTEIRGKWHKQQYLIKRKLGSGTVGTVYLCAYNGKLAALKISQQSASMTIEVNVLKALKKVQGNRLGPYLLDVDDLVVNKETTYTFYVMEYLQGESLGGFIKNNGNEWIGVLMLQLLEDLERLHQSGWIFGDLKTDNLLVLNSPPRVRWVDVGGTTQMGRAIKEYTEFYDRGYWGMGTRRAEPSYDLFAFVMVFLTIFYTNHFSKSANPEQMITEKIDKVHTLAPYRDCFKKAILGKYKSSAEMKQDLVAVLYSRQKQRQVKRKMRRVTKLPLLIESGGILLLAAAYYISSILFL